MTTALFEPITAHCFFQRWCQHIVHGLDPQEVHDEMEAHYRAEHYGKHMTIVKREANP